MDLKNEQNTNTHQALYKLIFAASLCTLALISLDYLKSTSEIMLQI